MARDVFGRLIKKDVFGNDIPEKQLKKEVIAENRRKGKAGEESFRLRAVINGREVERSPKGKDFIVRKKDIMTGKVTRTEHVEVKTGNAKLSELQKKTKKKKSNYRVVREKPMYW
jgi:hypothetical protein